MDTSAYLRKQGWRGSGHSLDHTDRGIKKPLLVSKKIDVLGLGLNKHAAVSDQWWLRAFDQGLKDFGTGKTSLLGSVQRHGVNRGGLYGRFVQGDGVPGTLGQISIESTPLGSITSTGVEEAPETAAIDALSGGASAQAATVNGRKDQDDVDIGTDKMVNNKRKMVEGLNETRKRLKTETSEQSVTGGVEVGELREKKGDKYKREKLKREAQCTVRAQQQGPSAEEIKEEKKARRKLKSEKQAQKEAAKLKAKAANLEAKRARRAAKKPSTENKAQAAHGERQELDPKKLALYTQRAAEKGVSLETYIKRREEKAAEKAAEKLTKKEVKDPLQSGADFISLSTGPVNNAIPAGQLSFVVDTTGDTVVPTSTDSSSFAAQVCAAIGENRAISLHDPTVNEIFEWEPQMPVPLEPRIWAGITARDLPKAVRKARKDWMAEKREAKKAARSGGVPVPPKKSKGQRKVELRQALAKRILLESRAHMDDSPDAVAASNEDGSATIPRIAVKTKQGSFTKTEVAMARTASRRVFRDEKRAKKADPNNRRSGRGKRQANASGANGEKLASRRGRKN